MSRRRRRGLPASETAAKSQSRSRPAAKRRRRLFSFRLWVRLIGLVAILAVLGPALFVGVRCYSATSTTSPAAATATEGLPGHSRAESLSYLTLPEWFIVFSADEYATFIGRQSPSRFPYLGSVRQYWTYYSAACGVTKGVYPFDTGYHLMLAIIGTSFTIENTAKSIYENTIGRLTEWLATAETPEDAFARRTAQE